MRGRGSLQSQRWIGNRLQVCWLSVQYSCLWSQFFKANLHFSEPSGVSCPLGLCFLSITLPQYLHTCRNTPVDLILALSFFELAGIRNKTTELYQNFIIKICHVSDLLSANSNTVYIQHMGLHKKKEKVGTHGKTSYKIRKESPGNDRDKNKCLRLLLIIRLCVKLKKNNPDIKSKQNQQ